MKHNIFLRAGCCLLLTLLALSHTALAQNKYKDGDYIKLYALKGSLDLTKTKYKNDADYYERKSLAKMDMEAIILLMPPNPITLNTVDGEYFAPSEPKGYFNIRTGLRFNGRGEKEENEGDEYTMSIYYLTLPVYLQYNLPVKETGLFFAGLGPYYGYALFGKYVDKINGETTRESIKFGKDESGLRRGDFGLGLVAGYVYRRLLLQLSYDFGLSNINFEKDFKAYNRAFGFSVGYVLKP